MTTHALDFSIVPHEIFTFFPGVTRVILLQVNRAKSRESFYMDEHDYAESFSRMQDHVVTFLKWLTSTQASPSRRKERIGTIFIKSIRMK